MTDPIELLQERLDEIEAIDCTDRDFVNHRNKYYASIELLKSNGFFKADKKNHRKLTDYDVKFIENNCNFGELDYFAELFNVHKSTIEKVIQNRRRKMQLKIKSRKKK